jgi:hypothetical protein
MPVIDDWPFASTALAFHVKPAAGAVSMCASAVGDEATLVSSGFGNSGMAHVALPPSLRRGVESAEMSAARLSRALKTRSIVQGALSILGLVIFALPFVNTITSFAEVMHQDPFIPGLFAFTSSTFGDGIMAVQLAALIGARPMGTAVTQARAHGFFNEFIAVAASATARTPQTAAAAIGTLLFGTAVRTCAGAAVLCLVLVTQRMPDSFFPTGAHPIANAGIVTDFSSAPLVFPFVTEFAGLVAVQLLVALVFGVVFARGRVPSVLIWMVLLFPAYMGTMAAFGRLDHTT